MVISCDKNNRAFGRVFAEKVKASANGSSSMRNARIGVVGIKVL